MLNHTTKGFPLKIMHRAFSLPPVGVVNEMRTPLLAQVPSFFDRYEVGHAGQAKVCEFKCKERNKMPVNIYKMGLALGVSRTWRMLCWSNCLAQDKSQNLLRYLEVKNRNRWKSHPSNHGSCRDWWLEFLQTHCWLNLRYF